MALRAANLLWLIAMAAWPLRADDVLFIGNSFTFGASKQVVVRNGGVPKLFEEIARAKGKNVTTASLTKSGMGWDYHLAQPETATALNSNRWTWVVLQDLSTRPTHVGEVAAFLRDGGIFSNRIAEHSPDAGIALFETWARPKGGFYSNKVGRSFSGPEQMLAELHENYGRLCADLSAKNSKRAARIALVGTAFARANRECSEINVNAADQHHASPEGYYLAALVIYETIYDESVAGAPATFFHGELTFPEEEAAKLQKVADEVAGAR